METVKHCLLTWHGYCLQEPIAAVVFSGVATGKFSILTETVAAALTQATLTQATLIEFIWPKGEKHMKLRGGLVGKMELIGDGGGVGVMRR